jgi:hypothetical protein
MTLPVNTVNWRVRMGPNAFRIPQFLVATRFQKLHGPYAQIRIDWPS